MTDLLHFNWTVNPRIIDSLNTPRWYGLMWGLGFYLGFEILRRIYKKDGVPSNWVDKSFIYVLIGGVLGARLGHCLFYEPEYYLSNPIEILFIWKGGLASHGGAIGVIIATIILNRKVIQKSVLWILDRLIVPTALAAGLIRLGNLFNHEILGKVTTSSLGFKFLRDDGLAVGDDKITLSSLALRTVKSDEAITNENYGDKLHEAYNALAANPDQYTAFYEAIPIRYPAQLFEAICYFLIFGIVMWLFWKTNARHIKGFLTGTFFVTLFGARFLIEFIKENQDGVDAKYLEEGLNMGQFLSIPLVLFGLYLVFRNFKDFKMSSDK